MCVFPHSHRQAHMKWLEEYNIGIEDIDSQHRQLADTLTRLKQSFSKEEEAVKTLKFLVRYTELHFSTEEAFMQSIDYPDYKTHKQQHEKLTNDVKKIILKLQKEKRIDPSYLIKFVSNWLKHHILEEDRKIGTFHRGE